MNGDAAKGTDGNDEHSESTGVPADSNSNTPSKAESIINMLAYAAMNLDTALDSTGVKAESVDDNVSVLLPPPSRNDELGLDYADYDYGRKHNH